MPYIKEEDKQKVRESIPTCAGELNFKITELVQAYFIQNGARYQQINDIVGALEGAKLEFTRRVTNPYEDSCIARNGDVLQAELKAKLEALKGG